MNKLTKLLAVVSVAVLISGPSLAQMRGGPGPGSDKSGPPAGSPPGDMGPGGGPGGPEGGIAVAPDGIVFYQTHTAATTTTAAALTVHAVGTTGTALWALTVTDRLTAFAFAGDLVLLAETPVPTSTSNKPPSVGTLIALHRATGAEAWRTTLSGAAGKLEAATDRVYAVVLVPDTTATAPPFGHESLVAVDLTGHILWTYSLAP